MSQLKVDTITDELGTGSPSFPNGIAGDGSGLTGVVKTSGDQSISGTITATSFVGNGSGLTNLPSSAPTTAQVLTATAGASVGAVGTYAFLTDTVVRTTNPGATRAGSALRYAHSSSNSSGNFGAAPAGTWRAMGLSGVVTHARPTVWLRIS
jgi:hypothetical protein